eukprot:Unigene557_Nuclearia_a/m.1757 Unigene557_Nuclearia_a/g.1757  ORF Unigene557_Nuclearia_a/g.1757 Unigene557_Nuclearia_a/m.1757 type:complete len:482 (+) Unigene557_Nuclearia_a:6233-7678(+)
MVVVELLQVRGLVQLAPARLDQLLQVLERTVHVVALLVEQLGGAARVGRGLLDLGRQLLGFVGQRRDVALEALVLLLQRQHRRQVLAKVVAACRRLLVVDGRDQRIHLLRQLLRPGRAVDRLALEVGLLLQRVPARVQLGLARLHLARLRVLLGREPVRGRVDLLQPRLVRLKVALERVLLALERRERLGVERKVAIARLALAVGDPRRQLGALAHEPMQVQRRAQGLLARARVRAQARPQALDLGQARRHARLVVVVAVDQLLRLRAQSLDVELVRLDLGLDAVVALEHRGRRLLAVADVGQGDGGLGLLHKRLGLVRAHVELDGLARVGQALGALVSSGLERLPRRIELRALVLDGGVGRAVRLAQHLNDDLLVQRDRALQRRMALDHALRVVLVAAKVLRARGGVALLDPLQLRVEVLARLEAAHGRLERLRALLGRVAQLGVHRLDLLRLAQHRRRVVRRAVVLASSDRAVGIARAD